MSRKHHENRSRSDVAGEVDHQKQKYEKHRKELEEIQEDNHTVRDATASLEKVATIDGTDAAMSSMENAKTTTEKECIDEGAALKDSQRKGKELEGDLEEREAGTIRDMERIGQAGKAVHSDASRSFLEGAEAQEQEEIAFLHAHDERVREAREASEQDYERIHQSVFGSGG